MHRTQVERTRRYRAKKRERERIAYEEWCKVHQPWVLEIPTIDEMFPDVPVFEAPTWEELEAFAAKAEAEKAKAKLSTVDKSKRAKANFSKMEKSKPRARTKANKS